MIELNEASGEPSPELALPQLHCRVARGDTIRADLIATMPAAILAGERLYYFEIAATADSTAHAIAGALCESRVDANWQLKGLPFSVDWKGVEVGSHVTIRDARLEVPHFRGRLHHVAVLDTSGELILADSDRTLWMKLRSRMSCPTLEAWGESVMPEILRSKLLIPALSFGMEASLKAYILAPDAAAMFDQVIAAHVRQTGGLQISARRFGNPVREAA